MDQPAPRYARRRNLVTRPDGRLVNVARPRGQLFVCASGCCCGRTEDGFPPVPTALFHDEWERRRLRNVVHLTIGGCLGPCALANVVMLLFDGQALWFQSINAEELAIALYDFIERMLEADAVLPAPPSLRPYQFTASSWQPRPDGMPVDDHRPRRPLRAPVLGAELRTAEDGGDAAAHAVRGRSCPASASPAERFARGLAGPTAVPRQNGELVFGQPWEGRAFGMAVALSERGAFEWEEFRQVLIAEVARCEGAGDSFRYYEVWLAALERVLASRGLVAAGELEEITFQFEYGERGDVFYP
jgi:nitrile hydratase accessory protein